MSASSDWSLLLEAAEIHDTLVGLLPASGLGALACTCRALRELAERSLASARRWKAIAKEQLGVTSARVHEKLLFGMQGESPSTGDGGAGPRDGASSQQIGTSTPQLHELETSFWRRLCRSAASFDEMHWSGVGSSKLWNSAQSNPSVRRLLARSGHSATLIDEAGLLIITGGLMDDDGEEEEAEEEGEQRLPPVLSPSTCGVIVIRLIEMEVLLPTVEGEEPPARCRHVAVRIPMSVLGCREVAALKGNLSKEDFDSGAIIALHGGYMGRQTFGGSELLLLWVSADGSRVRWSSVETFGWHPPPCFHHTVVALRRSPVLILLGGETSSQHLPAGFIYALWLHTMTWEKMPTSGTPHEGAVPGPMWLHVAALRPDHQGRQEEVVVFGGTGPDGLCSMAPRVLDTITLQWRIASLEEGGEGEEAMPPGRHRAGASASHCGRFLLVHGGCPPRGQWLRDTWVLDLEALEWRPAPLQVRGRQLRHSAIAGHTMEGMVAFGGCFRGLFGIMPVAKVDMLLLGPAPPPVPGDRRESHRRRREGTLAELEVLGQVTLHGETMQVVRHPRHGGFAIPMHMFDSMMEAMAAEEDEDEEEESQEGDKDDIHSEDNAERVEAEGGTGGIHSDGGGEEEGRGEDADPPVLASHPLVDLTDDVSD